MRLRRAWRAVAVAVACGVAACMGVAGAVPTPPSAPTLPADAIPSAGSVLVDPDFGVSTREFGLDRQVQMYQWRRSGDQFDRVWSAGRIESADFGADYQNPPLPIDSQRWWARDATLGGHPLDETVLQALGEWRPFRPAFSELPLNMAATFQPEGDGLGSAENPLAPAVGDLRITWRELHLPVQTELARGYAEVGVHEHGARAWNGIVGQRRRRRPRRRSDCHAHARSHAACPRHSRRAPGALGPHAASARACSSATSCVVP